MKFLRWLIENYFDGPGLFFTIIIILGISSYTIIRVSEIWASYLLKR